MMMMMMVMMDDDDNDDDDERAWIYFLIVRKIASFFVLFCAKKSYVPSKNEGFKPINRSSHGALEGVYHEELPSSHPSPLHIPTANPPPPVEFSSSPARSVTPFIPPAIRCFLVILKHSVALGTTAPHSPPGTPFQLEPAAERLLLPDTRLGRCHLQHSFSHRRVPRPTILRVPTIRNMPSAMSP